MMSTRSVTGFLMAGVCSLALTVPVQAQETTPTPELDVIVVTAQNRTENIQDVPIAISVISGETLKEKGVTDFLSVQKVAPALNITNDTGNTRVTVRGVGTLSNNEAQDQSIAVNIDGEYLNRPRILNAAIFDLERVEVLRGPQGTLYGRNSTGGAVNFITRKPGDKFAVNASATYGNYDQIIVEGGVDLPIGDVGGIRVAGFYREHDGYSFHPNTPFSPTPAFVPNPSSRSDNDHTGGGRISLRLAPASGLTIDAAIERVEQDLIVAAQAWADMTDPSLSPGTNPTTCSNGWAVAGTVTSPPPGTPTVIGVQCLPENTNALASVNRHSYNSPFVGVGTSHQVSTAVRGRIAWDFGPATLTYTGGYRDTSGSGTITLSPAFIFTGFPAGTKTQSHELRLNGTTQNVKWQGGAFFFKEKQTSDGGLYSPFIGPNGSYINYFQHPTTAKSWSVFGQAEVPFGDTLTGIVGGRYTKDKRSANWRNFGFQFNSGPVQFPASSFAGTPLLLSYSGAGKVTWLAGLNYTPNDDTLIYAKVSTGYKAGGFDSTATTFKPETNTAYEGGAKLSFGRSTLNVAGFYYDYKDLQNEVLLDPSQGAQTFNAGKAEIYGIEAEANIRPSSADTITASAMLMHAKYKEFTASVASFDVGVSPALPTTTDLAGHRLPQAPRILLTLGWDHVFDLGSAGTLTASAYTRYKGNYYMDAENYNDSKQTGRTQTDLSLEYSPENKHFSVQAYVRNLEDYRSLTHAGNVAIPGVANVYNWQFSPPRTYGARVSVNF